MTSSDYPLATLLDLRKRAREDAEQTYGDANVALERARRHESGLQARLEEAILTRKERCAVFDEAMAARPTSALERRRFEAYLDGLRLDEDHLRTDIEEARAAVNRARTLADAAREALMEAIRQQKAVERHHEQWLEERKLELERKQADAMDDIAARIWQESNR